MREHETRVRVRYGETDKMGVVYHPNYFVYFELGRTELMRRLGVTYSELEAKGVFLVVVEVGCSYKGSAVYDQELLIQSRVTSVSKARVRFDYEVSSASDRKPLAEGYSTLACLDAHKKPQRLPDEVMTRLSSGAPRAMHRTETLSILRLKRDEVNRM